MRPYFADLGQAAQRLTMNESDAKDLVQEVCMKAFLKFDELEQMQHQRAWLLKVMYHRFIDITRSQQRSPVDNAETIDNQNEAFLVDGDQRQPDVQVDQQKRIERVLRAMAVLPKEDCSLLAMHDIDGFSISELHEATGIEQGTIKSRLFRTRAKLGRLLQNEAMGGPKLRVVGGEK